MDWYIHLNITPGKSDIFPALSFFWGFNLSRGRGQSACLARRQTTSLFSVFLLFDFQ